MFHKRWFASERFGILVVALLFGVLTVFMTRPLVSRAGTHIIGPVSDNFYFVWLVDWFEKALLELHTSPLTVPFLNYPEGWSLAYNEMTPAMVLIGLPVSVIWGPVLGYNFSILVSFVLSGLGMYWWVKRETGNTVAGVAAGIVFTFSPFRMTHILGHLNLMGTQWLPFYFMGLGAVLREEHLSFGKLWLTSMLIGLISLTSQYYAYMTILMSAVYIGGYLLIVDRGLLFKKRFWQRLGLLVLLATPIVALSVYPYLQLSAGKHLSHRSFEEVRVWSASLTDFVIPPFIHCVWGRWVLQHFNMWIEHTVYIGLVSFVLTTVAVADKRRRRLRYGWYVDLSLLLCAVAFVLALGTDLHWMGKPVIVDVPKVLQRWHPYQRTFIPLPGYFLLKYLPYYNRMRVWARYSIFVYLFMGTLAGVGLDLLMRRVGSRLRVLLSVVVIALLILDFCPRPYGLVKVEGRPVDKWLAEQQGNEAVVQIPFWQSGLPGQVYYTSIRGKPFLGAFVSAYYPPQFKRVARVLESFPDQESVALLDKLGVRWVVVDSSQYSDFDYVHTMAQTLGLKFAVALDGQYVYELK